MVAGGEEEEKTLQSTLMALIAPLLLSTLLNHRAVASIGTRLSQYAGKLLNAKCLPSKKRTIERVEIFDSSGYQVHQEENHTTTLFKAVKSFASECSTLSEERAAHVSLVVSDRSGRELRQMRLRTAAPPDCWVGVREGVEMKVTRNVVRKGDNGDLRSALSRTVVCTKLELRSNASATADQFASDALAWFREKEKAKDETRYMFSPLAKCRQWKRYKLSDEKTFDTLFFSSKARLVKAVADFEAVRGAYAAPGFPHKLGLLLHGPPGTGKTSVIKALAHRLNRHVVNLPLSRIGSDLRLASAVRDCSFSVGDEKIRLEPKDCVFVMEDLDAASELVLKRTSNATSTEKQQPLSLAGLLDVLDGIVDVPGRVVVLTSNYPDRLDPDLVRPGRVSMNLYLGHVDRESAVRMAEHYQDRHGRSLKIFDELSTRGHRLTPAQFEHVIISSLSLREREGKRV